MYVMSCKYTCKYCRLCSTPEWGAAEGKICFSCRKKGIHYSQKNRFCVKHLITDVYGSLVIFILERGWMELFCSAEDRIQSPLGLFESEKKGYLKWTYCGSNCEWAWNQGKWRYLAQERLRTLADKHNMLSCQKQIRQTSVVVVNAASMKCEGPYYSIWEHIGLYLMDFYFEHILRACPLAPSTCQVSEEWQIVAHSNGLNLYTSDFQEACLVKSDIKMYLKRKKK